jgi:lipopolysaccharide/colanic/teichoic acid biosynthesis glycosyltransferase
MAAHAHRGQLAARSAPKPAGAAVTRALDVVLALAALAVSWPLIGAGWLAAWSTSAGPGLFRQQRFGRDCCPFTMLKLRTMRVHCDEAQHQRYVAGQLGGDCPPPGGGMYKMAADPRVTKAGAILRKTSVDELPQLINVLRGEMSLVGPRPVLRREADLFGPADQLRFEVRPGITGLWQASGRSKLSMRQALDLDAEFVRRRTISLYLSILLRTMPAVLRGEAA